MDIHLAAEDCISIIKKGVQETNKKENNYAKKLFDQTMMKTINMVITLRKVKPIGIDDAVVYFSRMFEDMRNILEIRHAKYTFEIFDHLKQFELKCECPTLRCVYERFIFKDP